MKILPKLLLIFIIIFASCTKPHTICGVPVQGTPWELANTIYYSGDNTFIPTEVVIYETKAYINGYCITNSEDIPASLVCDIENNKVINAILFY